VILIASSHAVPHLVKHCRNFRGVLIPWLIENGAKLSILITLYGRVKIRVNIIFKTLPSFIRSLS
jgi:hypothetical protein